MEATDGNNRTKPTSQEGTGRLPAYLQLASEIEAKIRSGALPPGSQLPPQRALAQERASTFPR